MTNLDHTRKKEFVENTISEYLSSLHVKDYLKNVELDEEQASKEFKQIGIRGNVSSDIFLTSPSKVGVYVSPRVVGLGRVVALGETDYFIKNILEDSNLSRETINRSEFSHQKLFETIGDMNARIILPISLKFELFRDNNWKGALDRSLTNLQFYERYPVLSAPNKVIDNNIIILDEFSAEWDYVSFENEITGKKERLDVRIGKIVGNKIEVIVRSMVHFKIFHEKYGKILQLV